MTAMQARSDANVSALQQQFDSSSPGSHASWTALQSPTVDHLSTARAIAPPPPSGVEVDAGMAPTIFPPVASSVQAGVGASSAPAARVSGLDSVTGQLDQSALHPSSQSPSAPNVPSFAAAPGYTYHHLHRCLARSTYASWISGTEPGIRWSRSRPSAQ